MQDSIAPARQELQESASGKEARYEFAFAQAPIGMVLLTPDGQIKEVNQAYLDVLGYTREELLSRDSSLFTHPDDIEPTREFFRALQNGSRSTSRLEKRYFRKDGQILWARASGSMRRDPQGRPVEVIAIVEDITERKRAEEQLWASQAQLRAIYDGTYEYIGLVSTEGIVLDCNRASLQFAGNTREDVIGVPFWDTPWFSHTPGAAEALKKAIRDAAAGTFVRYQVRLERPAGGSITFDFSLHSLRNERGEVIFLVAEGRDITEQDRAAGQIQEDRRRWRELLKQTPVGIAILRGPDHIFEWVNPSYAQLVDLTEDALLGKTVAEAILGITGQIYVDLLNGVYRTGEPFVGQESPFRLTRADGSAEDLFLNFVYLPTRDASGVIDGIFVHVIDVTTAVLARKQIEESENQFRTLAETIPHLAWIAGPAGNRVWFNRRWYDYTGTTFEDVKDWGWTNVLDSSVVPDVTTRWDEAAIKGEPFEMIYPVKGKNGEFCSFLTRVEPVRDRTGRVVRWFGTNTDITEQRRTEDELRRLNRELEEFAYVASHDLQEPIRMINIYTQLIMRSLGGANERIKQYAGFVESGVTRMQALIDDLLLFSRNLYQHDEQPSDRADLSVALEQAIAVLKGRIDEAGAVIKAETLPTVRGDTQQFTQVFQNMLSNSVKYRRADVPLNIQISTERDGDRWVIRVHDNGIGFAPQYAERIFGLFKRLHKEEYPGTGLGLAICKRIIERYNGRIWAEGRPGEGSTFYFSVPSN